ncbi:MAG: hypothetical protein Q8N14_03935 [Candidatus Omnitrophota bacterium]|nr:hypothetical protein [Candidatus Omnitrophota bacterium]
MKNKIGLYIRGHKTAPFGVNLLAEQAGMERGRSVLSVIEGLSPERSRTGSVFRSWKPRALARGASFTAIFLILLAAKLCSAQEAGSSISFGFSDRPDEEMIFMKLRRSLTTKANPSEVQRAQFALAEYYFKHNALLDAFRSFKEYAQSYPPEVSVLLAKIYLYKIATIKKDEAVVTALKKEMFDNSFVLLFSQFKVLRYASAFGNQYEVNYYLDKIKVFLNGGNFEEITP